MITILLGILILMLIGMTIAFTFGLKAYAPDFHFISRVTIAFVISFSILFLALFIILNWLRNHAGFGA